MAAVALLHHPCILEVVDIGALADGTPVIVSERPEGTTLGRWLRQGRVAPTDAAMDLLTGLAHALGAAHEAGVSHGALCLDDVVLAPLPDHALGFPRLRGFGHRWLRAAAEAISPGPGSLAASAATAEEIAVDVAGLAAIAERLLTPLQRGANLIAALRAAQQGVPGRFATPTAFVDALEEALQADAAPVPAATGKGGRLARSGPLQFLGRVLTTAISTLILAAAVHALLAPPRLPWPAPGPSAAPPPAPAELAGRPDPAIAAALVFPPAATAVAATPPVGSRAPRLWRVWSDRAQKVVYVDDAGNPAPEKASEQPAEGP
jgi:hypothetical protein